MKKYEVTLYFHTNLTIEVEAKNEEEAIEKAEQESCRDYYVEQLLAGMQKDSGPDVTEI